MAGLDSLLSHNRQVELPCEALILDRSNESNPEMTLILSVPFYFSGHLLQSITSNFVFFKRSIAKLILNYSK